FRDLEGQFGSETNTKYAFIVDPNAGMFYLAYSPPRDAPMEPLVPWTPSPLIKQGAEWNRLAVVADHDWLRLFINGQQVAESWDPHRFWGGIGRGAETRDRDAGVR